MSNIKLVIDTNSNDDITVCIVRDNDLFFLFTDTPNIYKLYIGPVDIVEDPKYMHIIAYDEYRKFIGCLFKYAIIDNCTLLRDHNDSYTLGVISEDMLDKFKDNSYWEWFEKASDEGVKLTSELGMYSYFKDKPNSIIGISHCISYAVLYRALRNTLYFFNEIHSPNVNINSLFMIMGSPCTIEVVIK